jgi:5-hydroxyisourate hydrolase
MKKSIIFGIFMLFSTVMVAQTNSYQLSSHILDVSKGTPASGVTIKLEKLEKASNTWVKIDEKVTDKNGRITDFLKGNTSNLGIYKLTYFTKEYFKRNQIESFYPFIEVVFQITDDSHYHVPITLSAFGYATYRGN